MKKWIYIFILLILVMLGSCVTVRGASADDIDLIAKVVYAEANNQCELGQRLVIDTILNRVDDNLFPNSIQEVILQKNQYSVSNTTTPELIKLVKQEIDYRINDKVLYFRTKRFFDFGTEILQVQDHYFSGR